MCQNDDDDFVLMCSVACVTKNVYLLNIGTAYSSPLGKRLWWPEKGGMTGIDIIGVGPIFRIDLVGKYMIQSVYILSRNNQSRFNAVKPSRPLLSYTD